jgi:exonuclease VII large subunit
MKPIYPVSLLLLFSEISLSQTINPSQAIENVNKNVRIVGVVSEIITTGNGTTYLNFGERYPNQSFTIVVFSRDSEKFKDIKDYQNKKVAITGEVSVYKNHPQIILKDPFQISVIP